MKLDDFLRFCGVVVFAEAIGVSLIDDSQRPGRILFSIDDKASFRLYYLKSATLKRVKSTAWDTLRWIRKLLDPFLFSAGT